MFQETSPTMALLPADHGIMEHTSTCLLSCPLNTLSPRCACVHKTGEFHSEIHQDYKVDVECARVGTQKVYEGLRGSASHAYHTLLFGSCDH